MTRRRGPGKRVCPQQILDMFKGDEKQKGLARKLAIDWARAQVPTLIDGDELLMPDPETGELQSLTYGPPETWRQ